MTPSLNPWHRMSTKCTCRSNRRAGSDCASQPTTGLASETDFGDGKMVHGSKQAGHLGKVSVHAKIVGKKHGEGRGELSGEVSLVFSKH